MSLLIKTKKEKADSEKKIAALLAGQPILKGALQDRIESEIKEIENILGNGIGIPLEQTRVYQGQVKAYKHILSVVSGTT